MSSRPVASPAAGVLADLRARHREAVARAHAAAAAAQAAQAAEAHGGHQVDWCSDDVMRHVSSEGGLELELDDDLSLFINSLTGSNDGGAAMQGSGEAAASPAPAAPARDSPPSVGAQMRTSLSFLSAAELEALHAAAPAPLSFTERSAGAAQGDGGRLRRSHTFTGVMSLPAQAPAPAPQAPPATSARKRPAEGDALPPPQRSGGSGSGGATFTQMMSDDYDGMEAAPPQAERRSGIRRSASLPMACAPGDATGQIISGLLQGRDGGGAAMQPAAAFGLLPVWAMERPQGAPPLLTPTGVPTFALPPAPPAGARRTSGYRGVSRAPWSTRWDAHVAAPASAPGTQLFVGSFDAEERAARAHDLATLKLHGVAAGAPACNFGLADYPGLEELAPVPDAAFIDALIASAYEPTERRYSKYRGVFRPRGAPKTAQQWEGRLEEAPASVAHAHTFSN